MDKCPVCSEMTVDPVKATFVAYTPTGNLAEAEAEGKGTKVVRCSNESCKALLRRNRETEAWEPAEPGDEPSV